MIIQKTCEVCGKQYKTYREASRYCSNECKGRAQRKNESTCIVCGGLFLASSGRTGKYCSKACYMADAGKRKERTCPVCGGLFTHPNLKQKYCSLTCAGIARRGVAKVDPEIKLELKRKRDARHNHIKRARRRGNKSERFDAVEIYERDRWRCHICGKKINSKLHWPDPLSPSLDHVIPSVLGGEHTKRNVKAAHLTCNVRKRARSLQEQLEMFG